MKKIKFILVSLVILLPLSSCSSNLSERIGGNFNGEKWKADAWGCASQRIQMLEAIQSADENVKLLADADIRQLFGRPDRIELFSRSQKFYLYYLEEGQQCQNQEATTGTGRVLEVSLDALGRLHEINIRL